jgi:hypothetical protein
MGSNLWSWQRAQPAVSACVPRITTSIAIVDDVVDVV